VDGDSLEALLGEVDLQAVCLDLGLDEDEGEALIEGAELEELLVLVVLLNVLDVLLDVGRGRADTADGEEDVVVEEVTSELLDLVGEGGREQESLATLLGKISLLHNLADLGLETHVEHAISLVEDDVLDLPEGDLGTRVYF